MAQKVPDPSTGRTKTLPFVTYWPVMRISGIPSETLNTLLAGSALFSPYTRTDRKVHK